MRILLTFILILQSTVALGQTSLYASHGSEGGGGGDGLEPVVNHIRRSILEWILNDHHQDLDLTYSPVSIDEYTQRMTEVLQKNVVSVYFTEEDILVHGKPKTCRGYYEDETQQPFIECNIGRFEKLSPNGQYRVVHHEFAGLVRIEQNQGVSSDYWASEQLGEYSYEEIVTRLGKRRELVSNSTTCFDEYSKPVNRSDKASEKVGTGGLLGGGLVVGIIQFGLAVSMPLSLALTVPLAAGGAGFGAPKLFSNGKRKVMKLILQSRDYVKKPSNPGKQLRKLYKKLGLTRVSMKEVAKKIVESDRDLSLCQNKLVKFKDIVKSPNLIQINL